MPSLSRRAFLRNTATAAAATLTGAEVLAKVAPPAPTPPGGQPTSAGSLLSLPKGGGAVKGIGETFQANPFTGTGNFSVPIYTTQGRGSMTPQLSLDYSTGNGNGPFGMGWSLSTPMISRKTEKGIPVYDDGKDTFVLSGAEDLTPYLNGTAPEARTETIDGVLWHITRYRPRTEGLHALIEFWRDVPLEKDGDGRTRTAYRSFWRIVTKDNGTNIYGYTPGARLSAPNAPAKIFEWRLELTLDAKGNCIWYQHKTDNGLEPDDPMPPYEAHRYRKPEGTPSPQPVQLYLKTIQYGNITPLAAHNLQEIFRQLDQGFGPEEFIYTVHFDYGEKTGQAQPQSQFVSDDLYYQDKRRWKVRDDPFSSHRAGFEIRSYRRCERVLMFHRLLNGPPQPLLVRSTDFHYQANPYNRMAMLSKVVQRGYRRLCDNKTHHSEEHVLGQTGVTGYNYAIKSFPPVRLEYSTFEPQEQRFQPMSAEAGDMPSNALNHPNFALVDLFGSGLPDVLYTSPAGYFYWKNEGDGRFSRRRTLKTIPADVQLGLPGIGFGDMAGDGQADLLVHSGSQWGFYETNGAAGWQKFRPYKQQPSFDLNDPQTRLLDLTGDGKTDAFTTGEDAFYFFPCEGEKGFGKPAPPIRRVRDLAEFPDVDFSSPRVKLADMSGDGLQDIVLVHAGRIDYWSNCGYGRFGRRNAMQNCPKLGADFDPKRLFLVDIDGSGTADAIYVEADKVRFWFNKSGNAWSEEFVIYGTPPITDFNAVVPADMFGNGATGLLWTMDWPGVGRSNYRYLDFTGGIKPNLLVGMDNSMGSTTRVQYKPSTFFYLEDLKKHRGQWVSALPFPVQCVEKVERIDQLSGTKLVTRYSYHHGFYDGKEREFRGFAFVEQLDSERFDAFSNEGLHNAGARQKINNTKADFHIPPVLTKTWYHTGVYDPDQLKAQSRNWATAPPTGAADLHALFRRDYYLGDKQAFRVDNCSLDLSANNGRADIYTLSEAYRALRGSVLRQEVYGLDHSAREEHPYTATESAYSTRLLQAKGPNEHAVYQVVPQESLSYHYERNPDDPRIVQEMTLKTDAFGNVLEACSFAYPRRRPDPNVPEQQKLYASLSVNKYINDEGTVRRSFRFIGVPYDTQSFEISGLEFNWQSPVKLTATAIRALSLPVIPFHAKPGPTPAKRRLSWQLTFFKNKNAAAQIDIEEPGKRTFVSSLPLGQTDELGLPYEQFTAIFQEKQVKDIFGAHLPDVERNTLLQQAGYVLLPETDGHWWAPSGQQAFEPGDGFYLPVRSADAWGNPSKVEYDKYTLLPVSMTDPAGNKISVRNDYMVMQPDTIRDANGNGAKVLFDPLGLVMASATMGKLDDTFKPTGGREGDYLDINVADYAENYRNGTLGESNFADNYQLLWDYDERHWALIDQPPPPVATRTAGTVGLLRACTTFMLYDLWRNVRLHANAPLAVYTATRELHATLESPVQQKIMYFDGLGRELQTKIEAEPVRCKGTDQYKNRYIVSGWKIYNNKGKPVRQYEPFYSETAAFEDVSDGKVNDCSTGAEIDIRQYGSVLFYDPLDRVVCTIHPNGTFEKTVFNAWRQVTWDVNDTVDIDKPEFDHDIGGYVNKYLKANAYRAWKLNYNKNERQKLAVAQTLAHTDTPAATHLDTLGRVVLLQQINGGGNLFETRYQLDISGNEISVTDPRGVVAFSHQFDLQKRKLLVDSVDAGLKIMLPDLAGQPVWTNDANGNTSVTLYDALRRPSEIWVQRRQGNFDRVILNEYGEQKNNAGAGNYRGRIWRVFDGAGVMENEIYDFKGNITRASRRLPKSKSTEIFWGSTEKRPAAPGSPPNAESLESKTYSSESAFDALNRLTRVKLPDGTVQTPKYDKTNLLKSVALQHPGSKKETLYVRDIRYNAKGQRERIQYGNGVTTIYTYEPETYRLTEMNTRRDSDNKLLQGLSYTYDPTGNITNIADEAIDTIFYCNKRITAENTYEYDPLYRLTTATGREHKANTPNTPSTKNGAFIRLTNTPADCQAIQPYTELYKYDNAGNLESKNHSGGDNNWTRQQVYETGPGNTPKSNRLIYSGLSLAGVAKNIDTDNNGNITQLPHLPQLTWNYANQLVQVQLNVAEQDDKKHYAWYQYDAQGNRVRKFIRKGNVTEERIYLGGYEIYVKNDDFRRDTVHVMDDKSRIALIETEKSANGETTIDTRYRYQLGNHLGSATLVLNETAALLSYEEYYAYGGTACVAGQSEAEVSLKRYRYSGKECDEETGLYYYGARYYAAWMGRWCGCDPAGRVDGENVFVFVSNRPITILDSNGLAGVEPQQLHLIQQSELRQPVTATVTTAGISVKLRQQYQNLGYQWGWENTDVGHPEDKPFALTKAGETSRVFPQDRGENRSNGATTDKARIAEAKANGEFVREGGIDKTTSIPKGTRNPQNPSLPKLQGLEKPTPLPKNRPILPTVPTVSSALPMQSEKHSGQMYLPFNKGIESGNISRPETVLPINKTVANFAKTGTFAAKSLIKSIIPGSEIYDEIKLIGGGSITVGTRLIMFGLGISLKSTLVTLGTSVASLPKSPMALAVGAAFVAGYATGTYLYNKFDFLRFVD